ncbi:hypothetical protein ROZALSC1DRAFT_30248, partial [Rozella allomycis CSF55]
MTKISSKIQTRCLQTVEDVICCFHASHGVLALGTVTGDIVVVQNPKNVGQEVIRIKTTLIKLEIVRVKNSNYVYCLGFDPDNNVELLVFSLNNVDVPHRHFKVTKQAEMITCFDEYENTICIGTSNGVVILCKINMVKDKHAKFKVVHQDELEITNVGIKKIDEARVAVFITTRNKILIFNESVHSVNAVDDQGCEIGYGRMNYLRNCFLMIRNEAVFYYGIEGKGPCYVFDGEKEAICDFNSQLAVLYKREDYQLTVYDMDHKFISFVYNIKCNPLYLFYEWNQLNILTRANHLIQFQEKDMSSKLEVLFKKNLYSLALNYAESLNYPSIHEIYKRYGDFCFNKGDNENAMNQYLKTIGFLEPSFGLPFLTLYLESLHEKSLANPDHTTLLINCYTKLNESEKLDKFIKSELEFDQETGIKVCRQSGYSEHALHLAKKIKNNGLALNILTEDLNDYLNALRFIDTLANDKIQYFKKYFKSFIKYIPDETCEFFKTNIHTAQMIEEFLQLSCASPVFVNLLSSLSMDLTPKIYHFLLENHLINQDYDKAMEILKYKSIDIDQAILICRQNKFEKGVIYLLESQNNFREIIEIHLKNHDEVGLIDTVKKYETMMINETCIWCELLNYFTLNSSSSFSNLSFIIS